jgi:F-type H+-transporting ATPase subunit gamma
VKRESQLRHRLQSLGSLHEAVRAMKSLSALHFRVSRAILPAARDYRQGIEAVLEQIDLPLPSESSRPRAILAVAADLGLCGDYNTQLSQAAIEARTRLGPGPLYCIGRRTQGALVRAGLSIQHIYPAPTSSSGLTDLLLQVAYDIFDEYRLQRISGLEVVSAQFEGAGHFSPVCAQLLPIMPNQAARRYRPSPYVTRGHLAVVAQREFVYITLYEILLEALASEHGARLVAAQSAEEWLEGRSRETHTALLSLRRENATQEVLDIAAGARAARPRNSGK